MFDIDDMNFPFHRPINGGVNIVDDFLVIFRYVVLDVDHNQCLAVLTALSVFFFRLLSKPIIT